MNLRFSTRQAAKENTLPKAISAQQSAKTKAPARVPVPQEKRKPKEKK